jgi:Concanavalin A-like lectin/glucanases superfamily
MLMRNLTIFVIAFLLSLPTHATAVAQPSPVHLLFDGVDGQVEFPNHSAFSVATTGQLTVEGWMRPDAWTLPDSCLSADMPPYVQSSPYFQKTEDKTGGRPSSRYVHWLGKGEGSGPTAQQEWAFRMYSCDHVQTDSAGQEERRAGRISFYIFNLFHPTEQNEGVGSYYQPGFGQFQNAPLWRRDQWIHVVGLADGERTYIYVDGEFKECARYAAGAEEQDPRDSTRRCQIHTFHGQQLVITPQAGAAPLRMAHRDRESFLKGALSQVRIWNRALSEPEIRDLHDYQVVPASGLVAEYRLDEGCNAEVHDTASLGAPNGQLRGGAKWSLAECGGTPKKKAR